MYEKMQESGLTEVIPLLCTSAVCRQYPVLSHPESPEGGCIVRGSCSIWLLGGGHPVSILSSLKAHCCWGHCMWWLDGCNILCLLIWQAVFFIHTVLKLWILNNVYKKAVSLRNQRFFISFVYALKLQSVGKYTGIYLYLRAWNGTEITQFSRSL